MKPTPSVRFALYVRASTEEQQNSLAVQEDAMRKYAEYESPGTPVLGPFVDSGVSGATAFFERAAVGTMLDAMQREGVTDIVITKLDRAFRNAMDCLFTFAELQKRGIHLHILQLKLDTRTPFGKFALTVMAGVAEMENGIRSERQRDAFAVMRKTVQRCGRFASFGWNLVNETTGQPLAPGEKGGITAANHTEQRILARLVRGDLGTLTACEAARRLNNEGAKTKMAGQPITRKGKTWICDGKWTAWAILSVKKNPRLAEGYLLPASLAA